MKYDLHSHSHFSDGALNPQQLFAEAKRQAVTHLALTDHDTVGGLVQAQAAADEFDVTLINGIELSCTWEKQLIHVVGLNIDPKNKLLQEGVQANKTRRLTRAESMHEDFEQHGIDLREALKRVVINRAVPTRPHFAKALIEQGYAKDLKQAFKRYLVKGKPGYIPMEWPSLTEVSAWIRAAGGVAVLAHPMRYKLTRTKLIRLITEMRDVGILGIEVSTSVTDAQQRAMLADIADQFGLLASIGSDFHSLEGHWARLGSAEPLPSHLTPVWEQW